MSEINNPEELENDLNEEIEEEIDDPQVMTVPIDETLSISGEAADAKAVGDALARKANIEDIQTRVKVNNQEADAQGLILLLAGHIPVSDEQGAETVAAVLQTLAGRTGADIKINASQNAQTIEQALNSATGRTADNIRMSAATDAQTVAQAIAALAQGIEADGRAIALLDAKTGAAIKLNDTEDTTIAQAIAALTQAAVKTVNGIGPDGTGNVVLITVPFAENLATEDTKEITGGFLRRTSAGSSTIQDGKAWLNQIRGNSRHDGFIAEELEMTVIPVERDPDEGGQIPEAITATIDRDTFVSYVDASGVYNLYYTTAWSADPALYGVTVEGVPAAGDQIRIEYTKEVRGTIVNAMVTGLRATGWNLYESGNGWAHVIPYSAEYGYKIGGTWESLSFRTDPEDEEGTAITPDGDGLFNITEEGWVIVEGGGADTYILTTWSDWTGGPAGSFENYHEDEVELSGIMARCFPNGMMRIGEIYDEIDRNSQKAISRIEREAYSEAARAAAAASGRVYDFDEEWIYIQRAAPIEYTIQLEGEYAVSQHGIEYLAGTEIPMECVILYGENLKDKLRRDVVTSVDGNRPDASGNAQSDRMGFFIDSQGRVCQRWRTGTAGE